LVDAAIDPTARIGENVQIWHFTYIGENTVIGDNTKIGSLVHIDYCVKIGENCKIEGQTYIPPGVEIGDGVFVGPGVVFTNDRYPMSDKREKTVVENEAVIGAGAVILPGITIGARAVVAAGGLVTRDVPPGLVVKNPHRAYTYETRAEYETKKEKWERK